MLQAIRDQPTTDADQHHDQQSQPDDQQGEELLWPTILEDLPAAPAIAEASWPKSTNSPKNSKEEQH